jgi:hypothetical protein
LRFHVSDQRLTVTGFRICVGLKISSPVSLIFFSSLLVVDLSSLLKSVAEKSR